MIKFFRKIRQKLVTENKFSKYLIYAIGEIVLVIIGILIALQINIANEARKQRKTEINYLQNIKSDLKLNIQELENYIDVRNNRTASANELIQYAEGKELVDLTEINYHHVFVQTWNKFYLNNNTYQELVNSGNFAIISNDSIKNSLLDLELLYKKMKSDEEHMRFDFEEFVYKPFFKTIDLNPMVTNFAYKVSDGKAGKNVALSRSQFEELNKNRDLKNGYVLAVYMNNLINTHFDEMKTKSELLIELINSEVKK